MSNDDAVFRTGLISFPELAGLKHLLCTYHLLSMNVKRHLRGMLGINGSDAKWSCF